MLPTLRGNQSWAPTARFGTFPGAGYEIDRLFENFLARAVDNWTTMTPAADLFETDEAFVVECELPGYNLQDVEVTVEQGVLTISGQRTVQAQADGEGEAEVPHYHLRERGVGRFSRSFSLPHTIDANRVQATLENGILRAVLPKAEEAKARRIEVRVK